VDALAHSVKLFPIFILLLLITPLVSALDNISSDPVDSNQLSESHHVNEDGYPTQFFYQAFNTTNTSLYISKIQLFIPSNVTESYGWPGEKWLKIGLFEGNASGPTLTPNQMRTMSWQDRFRCYYSSGWEFQNRGGYRNFSMNAGNKTLEPNTVYYIGWYTYGNYWTVDWDHSQRYVWYTVGQHGPGFNEWSVHRGNRTSSVWTDPFPDGNSLAHVIWGADMDCYAYFSGYTSYTKNTSVSIGASANSGLDIDKEWTYGVWLGNDSTSFTSFEQNITLVTDGDDMYESHWFTGLEPGKFYHLRGWITGEEVYPFVHGVEDHWITEPDAPEHLIVSNRTAFNTTLMWENGTCFEEGCKTVIFKSTDPDNKWVDDPLSPGDAVEVYNATGSEGNFTTIETGSEVAYYTAYSYIEREESGVNLSDWSRLYSTNESYPPTLDYTIYIYNEKPTFGLSTVNGYNAVSYELATKDHEPILMGTTYDNPFTVYCNQSDLLTIRFLNTTEHNWNNSEIERCYWIPISNSSEDRNISVYKPNKDIGVNRSDAKKIVLFYSDYTGYFTPADYGIGIIRKSIENETVTIHSDYIQADRALRTYLCQGDQYYFYARSDELEEIRLGGVIMFEDEYTLEVTRESITNNTWRSFVTINSGWAGESGEAKSIWLSLQDKTQGLYYTGVKLYNASGTLITEVPYIFPFAYEFNFTYNTGDVNRSVYWANIYMKYHKGKLWWNDSTNYFWSTEYYGTEVDMATLDGLLNSSIGLSPLYIPATDTTEEIVIPWGVIIVTGIAISFFFLFKPEHSAFALMFMGAILGLLNLLGMITDAILPISVVGLIIAIGVLLYLLKADFTFWGTESKVEKEIRVASRGPEKKKKGGKK